MLAGRLTLNDEIWAQDSGPNQEYTKLRIVKVSSPSYSFVIHIYNVGNSVSPNYTLKLRANGRSQKAGRGLISKVRQQNFAKNY